MPENGKWDLIWRFKG